MSHRVSSGGRMSPQRHGSDGLSGEDPVSLLSRIQLLEKDLERRQESYVTRERAYKTRIDELEDELAAQRMEKTGWMKSDAKMSKLKNMQNQILNNVSLVQDRTTKILQEQERDLLRAFRARLFDVQTELEKEKSKKDDGAAAWIERSRQLEAEVEWAKEVADRLERVNQTLLQENSRLKSQFTSQEEDRTFLIKQLVAVKKDNARLRAEYTAIEGENLNLKEKLESALKASAGGMSAGESGGLPRATSFQGGSVAGKNSDSEERYKEVNMRLRRLLADERKSLQQVRQNYALELKTRTEVELLLRQCVDDVRKEIARRYIEAAQISGDNNDLANLYGKKHQLIPIEQFSQEDRERAMELLLSQESVLTFLYSKAFPVNTKQGTPLALDASSAGDMETAPSRGGGADAGAKLPAVAIPRGNGSAK